MSALFDDLRRPMAGLLSGLLQPHKRLPADWLFDARGTALYQRLTRQPEHDAGAAEALLLASAAAPIAEAAGPRARVVVAGGGLLRNLPALLAAMQRPAHCALMDLADVLAGAPLPTSPGRGRRVIVVPGAVLALHEPDDAAAWLDRLGRQAGPGALLVTAADATTDPGRVVPAFNDAAGVAAELNRNALVRLRREADAAVDIGAFRPQVCWNGPRQRAELQLVSEYTQVVQVRGRPLRFAMGEALLTASFHCWSLLRLQAMAVRTGWEPLQMWMDGASRHAVHVLERRT